ncbi:MAG: hypothetical protein BGO51_10370 [Rhodospirillales bacterium 69-11]|nr:hypothetical protein [Rhodospirillales bacterium]OJW33211.1 MAG: hypothetical protein BGO51_10370 [Rhodospirillales bacterium 69-11]
MGRNLVLNGFGQSTERAGIGRGTPNDDVIASGVTQSGFMQCSALASSVAMRTFARTGGVAHCADLRVAWFGSARLPVSGVGEGVLVRDRGGRAARRPRRIMLRATTRNTRIRSFHW